MRLFIAFLLVLSGVARVDRLVAGSSDDGALVRMRSWQASKFGLFIHWGLYSVPAGRWNGRAVSGLGEWIMHEARIPVAEYAGLAGQFNPVKFDAEAWVAAAKDAGVKYIVITAKHHDGFAMYRSQASAFNVFDATPFHRDPLMELKEACVKQGIRLGFFYSQAQDWHHAGGATYGHGWDKAQAGSMDDYLKTIAVPQVTELLQRYEPAILWWDTPKDMTPDRAALFTSVLKRYPQVLTNDRLGGGVPGDFATPEQNIPAAGKIPRPWETCLTMNDTWGYKANDFHWKPARVLLHDLIRTASRGGNLLLNVGPTAEGEIPSESLDRLKIMGAWLRTNGEAIYGTTASPFLKDPPFGTATQKPGKVFLHVLNWPSDGKLTAPLGNKVTKAYLLSAPKQELPVTTGETGATITIPAQPPDPLASVVALEIEGPPKPPEPATEPNTK